MVRSDRLTQGLGSRQFVRQDRDRLQACTSITDGTESRPQLASFCQWLVHQQALGVFDLLSSLLRAMHIHILYPHLIPP